jgi:signal transduction histidine kinase
MIILAGSLVVIILVVFTMLFFIVFLNKKRKMLLEKQELKVAFEKTILQTRLEIQEQTFTAISQDIHDNVGQILSLVKVQLNILEQQNSQDNSVLTDAKENLSKALTDLRDIAKGLSSERIRMAGLSAAVEQEAERLNRTGLVHVEFNIMGDEKPTGDQQQLIIFRVIQEALQNIIKHAAAEEVRIALNYEPDKLLVLIKDDGKGFNLEAVRRDMPGLGLPHMFSRLQLIGGEASVNSQPGRGTQIRLNIPYE